MKRASMDQNFMVDSTIIRKIVDAAKIMPDETVLEIGAGKGCLTRELARRARKVVAIEIDPTLKKHLKMDRVLVITGNALEILDTCFSIEAYPLGRRHVSFKESSSRKKGHFDVIVSNLPYSICEALMNRLIFHDFRLAVLTVPKGFAHIIKAGPEDKKHSRLSLIAQTFYDIRILFDVPKEAFDPEPGVNSVVISLKPRKKSLEKLLFLQPKKLVKNALRESLCNYKKMTKSEARKAIKSFNLNNILDKKVMELTTEEFNKIVISLKDNT